MLSPAGEREERPVPRLFTYYLIQALVALPALPFLLPYLYFRYHTLRYRLDAEGLSMSWGILFRREIHLTYARIQDIHLVSNIAERWLGLARIQIQTASGSSGAQMTLEGIADHGAMRDFLYAKIREAAKDPAQGAVAQEGPSGEAVEALEELAVELRLLKDHLGSLRKGEGHA